MKKYSQEWYTSIDEKQGKVIGYVNALISQIQEDGEIGLTARSLDIYKEICKEVYTLATDATPFDR